MLDYRLFQLLLDLPMLVVISPAKNLDYETAPISQLTSQPDFLPQAAELIEICRTLTPADLSRLMKISDKLAALNVARYASWSTPFTTENAKQAVLAFNGDVYAGLDASSLSEEQLAYGQNHLRILSGLYGVLKPMDLMQPYRLEMGTKLNNNLGRDLYAFWHDSITAALNQQLTDLGTDILVNLASNEYFKSINQQQLEGQILTPAFKDLKNGQYKMISFFAKKARGMMARYIIQHQVTDMEQLKAFDTAGYYYSEQHSKPLAPVFLRDG
jgi:cytoplasmic iron level regulating protein YaaA (DUF328/UPF0246 family)